ncbi:MAG: DUF3499 family protein [Actinomycetota bacterium]|nr:DUF3499 family protein [Actinomycetota bacterium]MEE3256442.1 DUF3499 family protein [Actinomycetota bacterium]
MTVSQSRLCSRPLCANDAEVLLLFDYKERLVELSVLSRDRDPNLLELCAIHGERFRPPQGWSCQDQRESKEIINQDEDQYVGQD